MSAGIPAAIRRSAARGENCDAEASNVYFLAYLRYFEMSPYPPAVEVPGRLQGSFWVPRGSTGLR
jgi:hypothetical protein